MDKYFTNATRIITAFSIVILIIAILLIPEPKHIKYQNCPENISYTTEKCNPITIEWGPSITQRLRSEYQKVTESKETIIISPTSPTITRNWDTYINGDYYFQFKYPKYLNITNEGKDRFSYILSIKLIEKIELIETFDLNIIIESDDNSLDNYNLCIENAENSVEGRGYNSQGQKITTINTFIILGKHDACMQKMNAVNQLICNVLMQENEKIYTIQFSAKGEINSINTLINQILSTFSFIED